ncbi:MAG: hypothetical protein P8X70_02970 [Nanoarchaeota archaeon]
MFKKKECKKCKRKVNDNYDFCPYCGNSLNKNFNEDWGVLGKDDDVENLNNSSSFFGKIGEDMMTKMLGGAMKMLQRELQKEMKNVGPRKNFKLMINGKEVNLNGVPKKKRIVQKRKVKFLPPFSQETAKRFLKLIRKEPVTEIRRFSDKIIYEIFLPKVKSLKDISIVRLENSVEIKAIAEDNSYFKRIPINLPLLNYNFLDEKLIVEFAVK